MRAPGIAELYSAVAMGGSDLRDLNFEPSTTRRSQAPGTDANIHTMPEMADITPTGKPGDIDALIRWNDHGLVTVVTQDRATGVVLMVAWADRTALNQTLTSRRATYYSRSRKKLWVKGDESGYAQSVVEVRTDCDGDCLLYVVDAPGPACHQLRRSCFSHRIDADGSVHTDRPVIA